MNDLLFTVKGHEGHNGIRGSSGPPVYDIEAGYTTSMSEKSKEMEQFFGKVEELKQDMAEMKAKQREIQHMHERSKTIVRPKEMQQHRDEMQVRPVQCALARAVHSSTTWLCHAGSPGALYAYSC